MAKQRTKELLRELEPDLILKHKRLKYKNEHNLYRERNITKKEHKKSIKEIKKVNK